MCAQLREIEYWRRLVAARLDLAIACVTAAPEPDPWSLLATGAAPPQGGFRRLTGLDCDRLHEVAALDELRRTLDALDLSATLLRAAHSPAHCRPRRDYPLPKA